MVLKCSGMPSEAFECKSVFVGLSNQQQEPTPVFIRTVICGRDPQKQTIVSVHGYGSAQAMFYKCIKRLAERYNLIMFDTIGYGGSSRPLDYPYMTMSAEESLQYFVSYIEKWRVAMSNLTDFYLVGHSLGAYLAGNYACSHPEHIKKLILTSPPGVCQPLPEGESKDFGRLVKARIKPPKILNPIAKYLFKKKYSPFDI